MPTTPVYIRLPEEERDQLIKAANEPRPGCRVGNITDLVKLIVREWLWKQEPGPKHGPGDPPQAEETE